jgi:pimeloyl-ACP methyl ester carboxylesterase
MANDNFAIITIPPDVHPIFGGRGTFPYNPMRRSLVAICGNYEPFFIPPGAEVFRRDNPNATVQILETGHFALETHEEEVVAAMRKFLAKNLG